jgi:ATP-dependent helicase HrpB
MPPAPLPELPISPLLPAIADTLACAPAAVIEAPPGAGKTTLVPLALLNEPWAKGKKILMLEPRRIAARAAAARMADLRGEHVGETIGYRIRLDTKVGPATRIEVLTEGLLTRRLQSDPALDGVGLVIFDEFHERSLAADLGLALALECQAALNPDLRILVMSATLDGARIAKLMNGAPVLRAEGRAFPVETRYRTPQPRARLDQTVASAARRALDETDGGILVFLPGEGEIRSVERLLRDEGLRPGVDLRPLYGALTKEEQDAAIAPAPKGTRKIVLATAIAETSLTIEDVRVVIDSGQQRLAEYDPAIGLTRLITRRVSAASAEQRRGRAGRVAPGVCYRLWSEPETQSLVPFTPPEILSTDLAPLALDLALWGVSDPAALAFLDPPPAAAWNEARALLMRLAILDHDGRITDHGRACAGFGAHPRLAHMMLLARESGEAASAAALAAILNERDVLRGRANARDVDLRLRLEVFARESEPPEGMSVDRAALARAREQARVWRRALNAKDEGVDTQAAGRLAALAFPERVAQARGGHGRYRMRNGNGAAVPESDPLANETFLAVAALDASAADARVFLAAPLTREDIDDLFGGDIRAEEIVVWDPRERVVAARAREVLEALILRDTPAAKVAPEKIAAAMVEGIREMGLDALPWTDDLRQLRARTAFLRRALDDAHAFPDLSDAALLASLEDWLAPFLDGVTRAAQLTRIDLSSALRNRFTYDQQKRLDALAPTHVTVPSGSRLPIDYAGETPVLAVRLQEMFGLADTPRVANGKVPLTLHLLSPARRPVQVTRDLGTFWKTSYADVKKDMKGRYPKHPWPDDPLAAPPTARAKPRGT